MKIELAKTAGFCFGVKRAVETVMAQVETYPNKQIYTYGPIIHNKEVVRELLGKGVEVIESYEELERICRNHSKENNDEKNDDEKNHKADCLTEKRDVITDNSPAFDKKEPLIIIRSHGVGKNIYDLLEKNKVDFVDATCPFVRKIHRIVAEESAKGKHIIIVGNSKHPEVIGICGWVTGDVTVIENISDAEGFYIENSLQELCIVAQTTQNKKKFQDLVEIFLKKGYDIVVLDTICNATTERQEEALSIARRVDAMIVIGDEASSNSRKLFEICREACADTYFIQTLLVLNLNENQLKSVEIVGITAGASTPNKIIEEVQSNVRINF
jgi:4-hydroxy-3-methylbut-2-enyl diphosphate reductase